MAEVAAAQPCPACGTLTTCSGGYADEQLTGACPCCGKTLTIQNVPQVAPHYVVEQPSATPEVEVAPDGEIEAVVPAGEEPEEEDGEIDG
jgi:hypothetical protein